MQIKTIAFSYERKLNLGNYESATIEFSAWADLDPAEDPVAMAHELEGYVKEQVREQAQPLSAARNEAIRVSRQLAGLPVVGGNGHHEEE